MGTEDGPIKLCDLSPGAGGSQQRSALLFGHSASVVAAQFNTDGSLLTSLASDKTVRLWDSGQRVLHRMFDLRAASLSAASFSHDGAILAVAARVDDFSEIRFLDAHSGGELGQVPGSMDADARMAFSPDGATAASVDSKGTVCVWDVAAILRTGGAVQVNAAGVAMRPGHGSGWDGATLYCGRKLRNAKESGKGARCGPHEGPQCADCRSAQPLHTSVAVSPDGSMVASGAESGAVYLYDISSHLRNEPTVLTGHTGAVTSLHFNSDLSSLVSGSADCTLRTWHTRQSHDPAPSDAAPEQRERQQVGSAKLMVVDQTCRKAAVCLADYTIRISDIETGQQLAVCSGHQSVVESLSFSPDASALVSVGRERTARVWDGTSGDLVTSFQVTGQPKLVGFCAGSAAVFCHAEDAEDSAVKMVRVADGVELVEVAAGSLLSVSVAGDAGDGSSNSIMRVSRQGELTIRAQGTEQGAAKSSWKSTGIGSDIWTAVYDTRSGKASVYTSRA
eukprot:jgi/Tetstr1/439978/TSEL_003044.t1